jgi:hypothetical protein
MVSKVRFGGGQDLMVENNIKVKFLMRTDFPVVHQTFK